MLSMKDLVARARTRITEISVSELNERLGSTEKPLLIDVRESDEFAEGYIAGAVHVPRAVIERDLKADPTRAANAHPAMADKNCAIAVYCRSGGRSALAAVALAEVGFTNVVNVAGGIMAWENAGLPVARD